MSEPAFVPWLDGLGPTGDRPYDHERVWIWRPEWDKPTIVVVADMNPLTNIAGLFWRPLEDTALSCFMSPAADPEQEGVLFHAITQNVRVGKMIYLWPEERPSGSGSWEKVGPVLNRLQGWLRIA